MNRSWAEDLLAQLKPDDVLVWFKSKGLVKGRLAGLGDLATLPLS
jgi:uncharacterized protein (DUF3820 family)